MSRGAAVSLLPERSHHIGSKDFPMPEKLIQKAARSGLLAVVRDDQTRLELGWRQIADGRVQVASDSRLEHETNCLFDAHRVLIKTVPANAAQSIHEMIAKGLK